MVWCWSANFEDLTKLIIKSTILVHYLIIVYNQNVRGD